MPILDDVTQAVGNTPLVRINRIIDAAEGVTVAAKLEFQNPGASVKDRIGVAIIDAAEASGDLKPGGTIVEGTSGNTGPNLDTELGGQDVEQVVESIADPSAEITPGYQDGVMPQTYGDDLDEEEINALAEYILTGETGEAASGGSSSGSGR